MADRGALRTVLFEAFDEPIARLERDPQPSVRRSIRRAWWTVRTRAADLLFDRGIETAGIQYEPAHVHPERVRYEPSEWSHLRRGLAQQEVNPTDVFIDFGSGKGRVLLQAARYPFGRVIGVEISEELNRTARANLDRKKGRLACRNIELVTADAAEYEVPDDATVGYLFYPFTGETFDKVIRNILSSLDRNPRRFTLVYACPELEERILQTGRFKLARQVPGGRRDHIGRRVNVYVSERG